MKYINEKIWAEILKRVNALVDNPTHIRAIELRRTIYAIHRAQPKKKRGSQTAIRVIDPAAEPESEAGELILE